MHPLVQAILPKQVSSTIASSDMYVLIDALSVVCTASLTRLHQTSNVIRFIVQNGKQTGQVSADEATACSLNTRQVFVRPLDLNGLQALQMNMRCNV